MPKFMVAISHDRGVTECFWYGRNITGELFSQIVRDSFSHIFRKGNNQKEILFLQDCGPSQNTKMSYEAMDKILFRLFRIPSQSLDRNPILNIFNLFSEFLRKDGIKKIKIETYEQFCNRVTKTLHNLPSDLKDQTIESMAKRIYAAINCQQCSLPAVFKRFKSEHHWGWSIFSKMQNI